MRHYRTHLHTGTPLLTYAPISCNRFSMPVIATHAHCLVIEGDDARHFAQAQFAGDVDALLPNHWQWNAWLDARGRVRALMHLADPGDGRLLALLRGGDAAQFANALGRFVLRAKARVTALVYGGVAEGAMAAGACAAGPAGPVFGYGERSLRLVEPGLALDADASRDWRLADIRAGWPSLPTGDPEFLPPALGLERLAAVAFKKGCYPGQEIVARLHYRGGHKLGLFHVRGAAGLPPGATLAAEGIGPVRVLDCVTCQSLNEALVVAPRMRTRKINVLSCNYDVVSRFDA